MDGEQGVADVAVGSGEGAPDIRFRVEGVFFILIKLELKVVLADDSFLLFVSFQEWIGLGCKRLGGLRHPAKILAGGHML